MRKALGLSLLFLATACGQTERGPASRQTGPDAASSAPGITPTAAPGVAFNYRYAFRVPPQQIATAQERHAQTCERLGISRCRITGMYYHLTDENDVEAKLELKLDPAFARAFGKQAIDVVGHLDGLLVESEISGEDVASQIKTTNRDTAGLGGELKAIEARLAQSGVAAEERTQLQARAQQLRDSIRENEAGQAEREDSLAKTPMAFSYASGEMTPGIRRAVKQAGANLLGSFEWILVAVVSLLPWILLALLGWWGWRWLLQGRLGGRPDTLDEQTVEGR